MTVSFRWTAMIAAVLLASIAHADPPANTELNGDPIDPRVYRAWAGNYRSIARYCAEDDDGFIVLPGYHRRTPSSRGFTRAQATDELTVRWRETTGGLSQNRMREPEPEEVQAYAYGLMSVEVGTYGYVHSFEIVEVLGPEEMLVKDIWLIDKAAVRADYERDSQRARANGARNFRDQLDALYEHRIALSELQDDEDDLQETHRLIGYSTRGLRAGERWEGTGRDGIQIGIARWEMPEWEDDAGEDGDSRRSRDDDEPRWVLVNPQQAMRHTLDEQDMIRLLDARGYTVAEFVELMREVRERFRERDEADARLVDMLLPPKPRTDDRD